MKWHHEGYLPPKIFKAQPSAGKIMASAFWNSEQVIHVDFLQPHAIFNA
jgi:hypothetical protein